MAGLPQANNEKLRETQTHVFLNNQNILLQAVSLRFVINHVARGWGWFMFSHDDFIFLYLTKRQSDNCQAVKQATSIYLTKQKDFISHRPVLQANFFIK